MWLRAFAETARRLSAAAHHLCNGSPAGPTASTPSRSRGRLQSKRSPPAAYRARQNHDHRVQLEHRQGVLTAPMKASLCLNMIVKNEAHVIARCLASVRGVIDAWVIVDTGSTDKTKDRVRSLLSGIPGELHESKW